MTLEWLRASAVWLTSEGTGFWTVAFYGAMVLLGLAEIVAPAFQRDAKRGRRWPANFSLALTNFALVAILPISSVFSAEWARLHGIGLLNQMPEWAGTAAVVTLFATSLTGYAVHVLMHKAPLLWRLHRVHHLDTHIDVSTSLRSHPAELIFTVLVTVLVSVGLGMASWVLILYELAEALINLFSHANIRLPEWLDRILRLLLVTPNMHCIHHSSYQPETDSNYGGVFSIWDRLFGTYSTAPIHGYANMEIGLGEVRDSRASDFLWQLSSPVYRTLRQADIRKARREVVADA